MDSLDRYFLPDDAIVVVKREDRALIAPKAHDALFAEFRTLPSWNADLINGAFVAAGKGGDHPFTYCMEVIVPAMEKEGKGPEDPQAFCGWWKSEHASARSGSQRVMRLMTLVSAVGAVRTEMYMGREHIVVPVVALREGVMQASNAPTPELVPRDVLTVAPGGWNGRPVVGNHPSENGEQVSANDPRRLERLSFGQLFHTRVEHDDSLAMEAYLDSRQAALVGYDAQRVLERARRGEPIEVSVGAIVVAEPESGVWRGADGSSKPYAAVWREIVPDHLAMLPEGTTGACSNDMGCGAPRLAAGFREDQPRNEKGQWSDDSIDVSGDTLDVSGDVLDVSKDVLQFDEGKKGPKGTQLPEPTEADKKRIQEKFGVNLDDAASVAQGIRVSNLLTAFMEHGLANESESPVQRKHAFEVGRAFDRLFTEYGADAFAALKEIESQGLTSALRDPSKPVPQVDVRKEGKRGASSARTLYAVEDVFSVLTDDQVKQMLEILSRAVRLHHPRRDAAMRAAERKAMTHTERALAVLRHPKVKPQNGLLSALLSASDVELDDWRDEAEDGEFLSQNLMRTAAAELSPSDVEMRMAIDKALRASEPGYLGLDAVYPDDGIVIYAVMPDDSVHMMRRKYKWHDNEVTLGDDKEEVRPVMRYEPVRAAAAPCGCKKEQTSMSDEKKTDQKADAGQADAKAVRVQAIIEDGGTMFTTEDKAYLEGLSDDRLDKIELQAKTAKQAAEDSILRARLEGKRSEPLTTEQFLSAAPPEIRQIVSDHRAAADTRRAELVKVLRVAQSGWSEAELQALPMPELERLAKAFKVDEVFSSVDFGGLGIARSAQAPNDVYQNPPDGYALALQKRRA